MKGTNGATALGTSPGREEALRLGRGAARLGRVLCLMGAVAGAVGLLGWITGVAFLTTVVPGQPQMKANTALSLILLGVAGFVRHQETARRAVRALANAAALIALVIGLGTTVEYATGRDLGIDQLLFAEDTGPYPGRPSPLTAVALALLSGASLLFDALPRARTRPSEWLILGAGLIAFAATVGVAFGAGPLYRMRTAPITGVAVPTAVGLLLISAGMFLGRPGAGIARLATSPGPGGALLRRLVLPGIVLPVLLAFGLSRVFARVGIQDVALLFATLVALATVGGLVLLVRSAAPLDRAHEALATSRAETRELLQNAPDGIFVADLEGRYTDVNRAGCEMLGYAREEIIGKTIVDLIPPEDIGRLAASKQHLLAGTAEVSEWRLRRKDGTQLPVELNAKILPDGRWQAFVRDISERRRVEDERQVFVSLIENSSDFIGIADPSGKPIYLNPAGRRLVGLPADFPVEKVQIADCYPAEDRAFAGEVILKTMVERGRWSGETHFRHWQTEAAIPVSDEHFIIRDPSGERVLGMGTVTRDITERKRAEEALRLSEARFSGIISVSADAIISVDEDQRITLFNDGAESIFGYARAEAIGAPLGILIPERFHAAHRQHLARFAGGPSTARRMGERLGTIMGRRKSGEEFPAEAAISKLDVGGRPILTVALRDITQRKRAEEEQRFLAEAGAVLASSLDYEQTLSTVGQLMVRDFADWCIVDLVEGEKHPWRRKVISARASRASLAARFEQVPLDRGLPHLAGPVLETRRPFVVEQVTPEKLESFAQSEEHLRILREINPCSILGLPLLVRGELLGIVVLISSRPARTYKPEDLRFAEALAERAALAIENGRLYRQAVHATQLRDEVLGVVAHDLRNPVAAITMAATALQRTGPGGEGRNLKPVESIIRTAGRMNRLIGDLLDVSLIEAGQLGIERARVSTRQLLADALDAQRPLAASASLEMRLELADDLPDVCGDQHRLLQVLENLVGNAIKFTPVQGRITVGAAPRQGEVLFWVADTGSGISPEGLAHVFDRFWQARKGTRQGAGLGLPITRGIIEAHRGRIWAESTLGRGSVFLFTVPEAPGVVDRSSETMH